MRSKIYPIDMVLAKAVANLWVVELVPRYHEKEDIRDRIGE
jgi:hypothetical protein